MKDDGAWNTVVVVEVECKGTDLTDFWEMNFVVLVMGYIFVGKERRYGVRGVKDGS